MSKLTFHDEFFAQVEPLLKEVGYAATINGQIITIKKGRQVIDIMPYYEEGMDGIFVCFRYVLRGKFLKQLSVFGRMALANTLSLINPAFNIAYHQRGNGFSVRYNCHLHGANNILYHLNDANECYNDLLRDLRKRLPEFLSAFPSLDSPDKQLKKTIAHISRWRISSL